MENWKEEMWWGLEKANEKEFESETYWETTKENVEEIGSVPEKEN